MIPSPLRPHTTIVLAMTVDGKIADFSRSPARFGSMADRQHLETQMAQADAVLFGAGTLRAYGTTLSVTHPELLSLRQSRAQPPQPIQMVASRSGQLDPQWRFFTQPVPRWLITTPQGGEFWQTRREFDQILTCESINNTLPWIDVLKNIFHSGIHRLAILGGGELIASLLMADCLDEVWITLCPFIYGGHQSPTPVGGQGFLAKMAPRLELLSATTVDQEVFLHYRFLHSRTTELT